MPPAIERSEDMWMRLELEKPVRCSDDTVVGQLADVIVDPVEKRVTHLVVKPEHGRGETRLVPIELAEPGEQNGHEIRLRCTAEQVHELSNVEDFAYLRLGEAPVSDPEWDVGVTTVLALPYFESSGFADYPTALTQDVGVIYDRIPKGEVEIRRSSRVHTEDDRYIGDVEGFLVDDEDHITHFVLERGHLWGRREVTVPIGAVTKVKSDAITVGLSTDEIAALPARKVHRWSLLGDG
jgi:sporulation protein YlmC with PRC-barrel domain